MADTQRSLSAVLALLADNTTRDISAQDIRDAVVTLQLSYGEIYVMTPAATTVSDTVTYYDLAGTYSLGVTGSRFDMNTNGQLRYTGAADIEVVVFGTVSITLAGSNDVVHLRAAKNGTSLAASDATRKVGTGTDVGSMTTFALTSMSTNDHLTLEMRNETATDDITAEHANLLAIGFAI